MFSLAHLPRRLRIYFSIFAVFIVISAMILYFFSPLFAYTQLDSAKFILTALVQGEATIIALVVTLSLIVIQLTASSYSTRVIDIFKESPVIWVVVGSYILAIVYNLTILKFMDALYSSNIFNFEIGIWTAYFLAIFAFGVLVPYLLGALEIMKSSTVIDMFAERITKENILSSVQEYEKILGKDTSTISYSYLYSDIMRPVIETNDDPIQPLMDIIHSSMMKYDYGTMRYGLKILENYMISLLKNGNFKKEEGIVAKHIFTHLERVGKLATSREDEDSAIEVVTTIFLIGNAAIENELESIASEAVNSIKTIGRLAIKREMEDMEVITTDFMGEIGKNAAQNRFDFAISIVANSLGIIGKEAAKHAIHGLEETVLMAGTLYEIGRLAINQKLEQSVFHAVNSMGDMGKYAARNDLPKTTIKIVNYLNDLGIAALEENFSENTNDVAEYLYEIGRIAVWSELNIMAARSILKHSKESLENINKKAKELKVKETILASGSSLEKIKELIKEKSVEDRTKKTAYD